MFCIIMGLCSFILLEILREKYFVYSFIAFFGAGWGVTAPMFMSIAADLFQGRSIGLIYGLLEGSIGIGGAFGSWVAGFIFDKTQSYQWAFVLATSVSIVSCIIVWVAAPRKVRQVGRMGIAGKDQRSRRL
jgi:MFS family permease